MGNDKIILYQSLMFISLKYIYIYIWMPIVILDIFINI